MNSKIVSFYFIIGCLSFASCEEIKKQIAYKEAAENEFVQKGFYPNGNLEFEFQLDENKARHGEGKQYSEEGNIRTTFLYEHGEKIWAASYFKNGQVAMEIPYKNEKKEGVRKKYYESGQLESEMTYHENFVGKGLKEYTKAGKLKTKYPELVIKPINLIETKGTYLLEVYFSENPGRGTYYIGRLKEGYLNFNLTKLKVDNQKGVISYQLVPGTFLMEKVYFVGEYKTYMNNIYVVEKSFNLAIEY